MAQPAADCSSTSLDQLCINTLRFLAADMVEHAASGHPGMPMGAAPMAYVVWSRFLRFNPKNPLWPDRDRFVLSAGHASAMLYSLLHLYGYDLPLEHLRRFRQWDGVTPGHPEAGLTPGVEVTTGPLGQGFANAVGLAIAERHLASRFNRPGHELVNHYTYVLASDGDLMEGIASEAASLAGHLALGRLICLYDCNHISLAASTNVTFTEDVGRRFEAYHWHVQHVTDGNDLTALTQAIEAAMAEPRRPSLIVARTHIGFGSPNKQDTFEAHGSPLGREELTAAKRQLGWPAEPDFLIPPQARAQFAQIAGRGPDLEAQWRRRYDAYRREHPELADAWESANQNRLPAGWDQGLPVYAAGQKPLATRTAGHAALNALAARVAPLIGGSADLEPSTKTVMEGRGSFQAPGPRPDGVQGAPAGPWGYEGANIAFGVREHAMGGILNGLAAHGGLIPFGSTFLVFSDYLRPSIRLAALTALPVKYVFTHDSVLLGEDGPTHQPIEHLAALRAIPNLVVIRPADANETVEAWKIAIQHTTGPLALVLTRQNVPVIDRQKYAAASGLARGAYVLADAAGGGPPELVLIATGSEVHPALQACETLTGQGRRVRLVSMPSWELFERQPADYQAAVLPPGIPRLAVEAGSPLGWERYTAPHGRILGMTRFGASAPAEVLQEKFGFTAGRIIAECQSLLSAAGQSKSK